MEGEATKRVKYRYLLEAVIDAEKIEVTDEEAKEEEHNIAKEYNMTIDEVVAHIMNLVEEKTQ